MSQKELRRVLSKLGVASRKDSEQIIKDGRVTVNGIIVKDPLKPVYLDDEILVNNREVEEKKIEIYALNKPKGYVSTMSKGESRNKISDLMPKHQYLFPVGRLDKASRGLLLFTNDNNFADYILSTDAKVDKIYRVQVQGRFSNRDLNDMLNGVEIDGIKYLVKDLKVDKVNSSTSWIEVTLNEGKNREIRRMLESFGYEVLDLIRIQIGKLRLIDLNINAGEYVLVQKHWIV